MKIILPGSIRSKKNSKIATIVGGKNKPKRAILLPSKAYRKWEDLARAWAVTQYSSRLLASDIHVKALIYYKGPQPDLSGCLESIGDCLEGIIWKNDKQIKSWDGSRLFHDKENPRTEIEINIIDKVR